MSAHASEADPRLRLIVVDESWERRFDVVRTELARALGGDVRAIEHIGSTAVPGLLAKPVLDVAVEIARFEDGLALVPRFTALGFVYRGENGIPRRHYFKRDVPGPIHVHVLEAGSAELAQHRRFRDRLRAEPELAAEYASTKRVALTQAHGKRERYQALKADFIAAAVKR
jgi:GrpB-like predicted nucleotidyltransferase (UPF0157 family)